MKNKISKTFIIGFALFFVAGGAVLSFVSLRHAHAVAAPTVNISFNGQGTVLNLSSSGPFTEDFKVTVCFYTQDTWPTTCVTSPWASQAQSGAWTSSGGVETGPGQSGGGQLSDGSWSGWYWPGHSDELHQASISVQTQALPAGETLNNAQIGIELSEANAGNTGSGYICADQYTPIGGGSSPIAYSYTYADCTTNPSGTPDEFSVFIGAQAGQRKVTMGDNFPPKINAGASVANPQITVVNDGNAPVTSPTWSFNDFGTGSGNCDINTDGGSIPDAPDPSKYKWIAGSPTPPPTYTCTIQTIATAQGISISNNANGTFKTPLTVLYSTTTTRTASYRPSYITSFDNSNPTTCSRCRSSIIISPRPVPAFSSISYSPLLQIPASGTATFNLPYLTATSTPGFYNEQWTFNDSLVSSLGPIPGGTLNWPVQVMGGGTITVVSENSVVGTDPVSAKWKLLDTGSGQLNPLPGYDGSVCDENGMVCQGSSQTYLNQRTLNTTNASTSYGSITIPTASVTLLNSSDASKYTLNSVRLVPMANKKEKGYLNSFFALAQNFLAPIANAAHEGSSNTWNQQLLPSSQITMVILWYPDAALSVNTGAVSVTDSNPSGSFIIKNSGTPGSTSTWNAAVGNYSANSNGYQWLKPLSPSTGSNLAAGATAPVTVTANPGSLPNGTYTAQVSFSGSSFPSSNGNGMKIPPSQLPPPITVTLVVSNSSGGGPPYFACGAGVCQQTSTPGFGSCSSACGGNGQNALNAACSPNPISLGQTSQCVLDFNGIKQNASWNVVSGSTGSIGASSGVYTPSTTGTQTVKGMMPDGTFAQTTITVLPLPTCAPGDVRCQVTCNNPSLTATPSSIVVPESSNLSYGCSNVTQCNLSGGDVNVTNPATPLASPGIISGTATTTPSVTTTYTLTCKNGATSNPPTSYTTQVTVDGSSFCEQNPNGVGCP